MQSLEFLKGATRRFARGRDEGKFERRLSEVNARAVSRGQNEYENEDKKYVNKKERERHLLGCCQWTSLESTDHDENR